MSLAAQIPRFCGVAGRSSGLKGVPWETSVDCVGVTPTIFAIYVGLPNTLSARHSLKSEKVHAYMLLVIANDL